MFITACGGGGGGGGANLPAFHFDSNAARNRVAGNTELNSTSAQIGTQLDTLHQPANSFLASDVYIFDRITGQTGRNITTCSGASCTITGTDGSFPLPLTGFDFTTSAGNDYQSVMTHRGVSLAQSRNRQQVSGQQVDSVGYGGWLNNSFFLVVGATFPNQVNVIAYSIGNAPNTNPGSTGGGTWRGVMVGSDADLSNNETLSNPIQGDAIIDIDNFSTPDVDILFNNIVDLETGAAHSNIAWNNISVTNGAFSTGSIANQIQGKFYGTTHNEVGGTFERNNILGAFGASR